MKNEYQVFAENLTRYMKEYDLAQYELAKKISVNPATVSSWIRGTRFPRLLALDSLCGVFNCTRSDLLEPPKVKADINRINNSNELASIIDKISNDGLNRLLAYAKEIYKIYRKED